MFIEGFGIAGYRSFGNELQRIGPLEKLNLIVGQNNSGKSNILLFLARHYQVAQQAITSTAFNTPNWAIAALDYPLKNNTGKLTIEFGLKLSSAIYTKTVLEKYGRQIKSRGEYGERLVERILQSKTLSKGTPLAWFRYEGIWGEKIEFSLNQTNDLLQENVLSDEEWMHTWEMLALTNEQFYHHRSIPITEEVRKKRILEALILLSPAQFQTPNVVLIPAIRKVGDSSSIVEQDHSGNGLINRLAELQNPGFDQQHLKEQFEQINNFLRTVTDNPTATLEIPYDRSMILVHMDAKTLPLASLGTGIHEVVILAAAATVIQGQILCIEEPELHLHPLLQKKLLRYLSVNTNNQYFITTHSAHLLDTPGVSIFHVRHQHGQSTVEPVFTSVGKALICADLGYRASDLLQANCVIWVEGPSDRIYLRHWIQASNSSLIEGVHYSIMFYGGRLLRHLTALDPEIEEFISLRRLNRYISILIDSDRASSHSPINATKRRIRDEFNQGPGFAWITKGREIENYIAPEVLERAVKSIYPEAASMVDTQLYAHCLFFKTVKGVVKDRVDKVKVAHEVVKYKPTLDVLDLQKMIANLVSFIHEANGV
ncbi:AAA family ATPase [Leptolyngbya sp. FACHB-321]|uniref:ATP-dependent nuclease n=1 Tax=Leptolyngbya sp. FACHB-321 TaxID=2692807 RepID=UPI001686019E|nr:ATP-binding protein [Leptolyngbya sp. FACHB-321]MBD2038581.1 AAA family ATPase [Leptolyngbya sp. FACHB-321]